MNLSADTTPYDLETCKILVLGDSGVGKTSLTHLLCYNKVLDNAKWTIGANVDVKIHVNKEGTPHAKKYFMELWDIGGATAYKNNRQMFYHNFYGLFLVYDITNYKSYINLFKWIDEVSDSLRNKGTNFDSSFLNVPVLLVANKADSIYAGQSFKGKRPNILDELGAEEFKMVSNIKIDCKTSKYIAPGQTNTVRLSRFFDKVISNKMKSDSNQQQIPSYPRNLYE